MIKSKSHKLDEKSKKCIFIGYCSGSKAYKLYNPISGKIVISMDVMCNEDASWSWSKYNGQQPIQASYDHDISLQDPMQIPGSSTLTNSKPATSMSNHSSSSGSSIETPPRKFISLKEIYNSCTIALFVSDPMCFDEAVKEEKWCQEMEEKLFAIQKKLDLGPTRFIEMEDCFWA